MDRLVQKWRNQQGGSTGWWWRICWVVPPVGLVAGGICLLGRWWKVRKGPRRRARGEVERRPEETIELNEMRGGRRRGTGSSITDED